jgi:hypothetical protein
MQRINKTNSWFGSLKKISKIDKLLTNFIKIRREKTQISKIRTEKGEITTNTKKIQGNIGDYIENLYSNKLENLEEMDKCLDIYDHPNLSKEDIYLLNRSITCNDIEAVIESPKKEKSRT